MLEQSQFRSLRVLLFSATLMIGCSSAIRPIEQPIGVGSALSAPADSLTGLRVVLGPELTAQLSFLYRYIQETEFAVCLEGRKQGNIVHVDAFRLPRINETNAGGVKYKQCDLPDYVGMAHNHLPHPLRPVPCYFSMADERTFSLDKAAILDVVICGENNFVFQSKRRAAP